MDNVNKIKEKSIHNIYKLPFTVLIKKMGDKMSDQEDWELIPHKVLADLRDEVHLLKEKLNQPSTRSDVIKSNDELRKSINQMQKVFETALSQADKEEDVSKQLANIEKQNEQIAKALVTIADLIEGGPSQVPKQIPRPAPLPMSPPSMTPMSMAPAMEQPRIANIPPPPRLARPIPPKRYPLNPPRRMPRADMLGSDLPPPPPMGLPPPPPLPEKKGLLGKLFKT